MLKPLRQPPGVDQERVLPFQSTRRSLRNYYSTIHMALNNPSDIDLGKKALDDLIRDNETEIIKEEATQV